MLRGVLFGYMLGVASSMALVGMGFYWGVKGQPLMSLVSPWLERFGVAGAFVVALLKKWRLWR